MTWNTSYPMPNTTSNMTGLVNNVVTISNGLFFPLILVSLFIVTFMATYRFSADVKKAFALSSWITAIPGFLFWAGGWLNGIYVSMLAILLALSIVLLFLSRG